MSDVIIGRDIDRGMIVFVHHSDQEIFIFRCYLEFAKLLDNWNPSAVSLLDERLGIDQLSEADSDDLYKYIDGVLPISIDKLERGILD